MKILIDIKLSVLLPSTQNERIFGENAKELALSLYNHDDEYDNWVKYISMFGFKLYLQEVIRSNPIHQVCLFLILFPFSFGSKPQSLKAKSVTLT